MSRKAKVPCGATKGPPDLYSVPHGHRRRRRRYRQRHLPKTSTSSLWIAPAHLSLPASVASAPPEHSISLRLIGQHCLHEAHADVASALCLQCSEGEYIHYPKHLMSL
jgi:hypothetical protein